jgi:hypothetical protein
VSGHSTVRSADGTAIAFDAPATGRRSDEGRTLRFAVPAQVRASARLENPLLVVSNGGRRPVVYVVSAR